MPLSPTPISLTEAYFDNELRRSSLGYFDEVTDDNWIEFAKYYRSNMAKSFVPQFLDVPDETEKQVRLYFEPRLASHWDSGVQGSFAPTPLLGLSPYPKAAVQDREQVSIMLAPLKKHLLFAHSVFLRDNFYYCFDHVAETVEKATWRSDPNVKGEVDQSILAIKNWLPILVELKEFIEAGILVFMPYYITPSFPYGGTAPNLREAFEQLRLKPDPKSTPNEVTLDLGAWDKPPVLPKVPHPYKNPVSEDDVIAAWLNARLMGLDVVFPDRDSFDFGSRLYVEDASNTPEVVTDLMSIENLPFGNEPKKMSLDDLWKIRKNEPVFNSLRDVVADCKAYLENNLAPGSTKEAASALCRTYLSDHLLTLKGEKALRVLEGPKASLATSVVVGIAVTAVTANPAVGITVGATANPSFIRLLQNRLNRKRRAVSQLQSLLLLFPEGRRVIDVTLNL